MITTALPRNAEPLRGAMDRLAARVRGELACHPLGPHALDLLTGGKRLRAALVFAAADRAADRPEVEAAAAAIELVHAGSLLHDDVVDRCDQRRAMATQHVAHGLPSAVWSGAAAVHAALRLACELPSPLRTRLAQVACDVAGGQLEEIERSFASDVSPAGRLRIMERKTASVFGLATELGSALAGDPRQGTALLHSAGRALGVLFQIADDFDDVFGSEADLGRRPGADLREGVVSLPLAFALQIGVSPDCLRDRMAAAASSEGGKRALFELLETSGAIEATRRVVRARERIIRRALVWLRLERGVHRVRPSLRGCDRAPTRLAESPGALPDDAVASSWGADWIERLGDSTLRRIERTLDQEGRATT